jgi:hypothetical protein
MKQDKRLQALETAAPPALGWRYYSTNDDLEAAGVWIDCNNSPGYRSSLAASGDHIKSIDDLDAEQRARVVSHDRIDQDERDGYRVLITRYTKRALQDTSHAV